MRTAEFLFVKFYGFVGSNRKKSVQSVTSKSFSIPSGHNFAIIIFLYLTSRPRQFYLKVRT